jgi:hypothetical protein
MKYAVRMLVIAVTFFPLLASAQLGQSEKIVAQVPFQFRAGNMIFPAGECTVQRIGRTGDALAISNWEAKASQLTLPNLRENAGPSQHSALVFHKYGDRYFLAGVKVEGSRTVYQIPRGRAEAELQAQNVSASDEVLLARSK